jgi:hypothetical protein
MQSTKQLLLDNIKGLLQTLQLICRDMGEGGG